MMALECEFKSLSDDLEEDEDLHNKLICDQMTSDEQITADNAKISTLETSISGESARVAQLTKEIGMLEKDIAASKSKFSDATAICEKQLVEYREANKAITEDIEISVLSQLKASFLSFQGTPDISSRAKCAQPRNEGVVIFPTVPRNQRVFPAVCQSER